MYFFNKLIAGAATLALMAGAGIYMAPSAFASDCLLDTNKNGNADSNIDTTGGANSFGSGSRVACGRLATAQGHFSTALGYSSSSAGERSTAVGGASSATGGSSTALGYLASTTGNASVALGRSANAAGTQSVAIGYFANAPESSSIAIGHVATATASGAVALGDFAQATHVATTALGTNSRAEGEDSTALGYSAYAEGYGSTALGRDSNPEGSLSIAVGLGARAQGAGSTAVGALTNHAGPAGDHSIALGEYSNSHGTNAIAIGADKDVNQLGADARGNGSIVIGADASDANFDGAIVIGESVVAAEMGQVILKSADTFTIMGNGDVGMGTSAPLGSLDINSGLTDTTLLLSNDAAIWEIKSDVGSGKMTFTNKTTGNIPFKFSPDAVGGLLRVGIVANDQVDVKGNLVASGTLTTGGPTCGGGCDAVFDANYDLPSIQDHAKQMFADKHLPAIGPTKPHAPVNLSEQYGNLLNELEKAHIYIAKLDTDKQSLQQETAELRTEINAMKALMEKFVSED